MKRSITKKVGPKMASIGILVAVAVLSSVYVIYRASSERSGSPEPAAQQGVEQGFRPPPGQLVRESGTQAPHEVRCGDLEVSPFSMSFACAASRPPDSSVGESRRVADVNRFPYLSKALVGDVVSMRKYVMDYFRTCSGTPPEVDATYSDCEPSVLEANNSRFLAMVSTRAAAGDVDAQFVLGRWYMVNAAKSLASQQANETDQEDQRVALDADPGRDHAADDAPLRTPELQAAVNYFAKTAETNPDARRMLALMESIGVRPTENASQ